MALLGATGGPRGSCWVVYPRLRRSEKRDTWVSRANWKSIAEAAPVYPVAVRARLLLEEVSRRVPGFGLSVRFRERELRVLAPAVGAAGITEMGFLLRHLKERGLIAYGGAAGEFHETALTVDGWSSLEPTGRGLPGRVFVAMWFADEMDEA
jgi:hypothetical protein